MKFPPEPISSNLRNTIEKVTRMTNDPEAISLAGEFGLAIQNVSWEDCARSKNSCWGPCISDMTLQVNQTPLPVIRLPNFTDVTWDQPLKNIPLNVGNEKGTDLQQISLYEYLQNINKYLHTKSSSDFSLLGGEKDTHAIMSSQACFLPIEEGNDSTFNVCLYNYQTQSHDPAVLVIVASSSGTSAQVVDNTSGQTLYFNKNGERASFVAKRLKDQRRERGQAIEGEMNSEEKADNMLLIIQVPLKTKQHSRMPMPTISAMCSASPMAKGCMKESAMCMDAICMDEICDVDQAIISVGDAEGEFDELKSFSIKRDPDYPIRVTLQYYKATSNGIINSKVVEEIAVQMITARSFAAHNEIGSLVTSNQAKKDSRVTEAKFKIASWWPEFWREYYSNFPDMSENEAKYRVFSSAQGSSFCSRTFEDVQFEIFSLLSAEDISGKQTQTQPKPKPVWDPSLPFTG